MPLKRKVLVLTGTRADYGILRPVIKKLLEHPLFDVCLLVVGMHLSDEFGRTIREIERDNFRICGILDTLDDDDTGAGMARYIGRTIVEVSRVLEREKPDFLIILGDRSEALAAAIAASCMNVLIVHLHGGESSGSVDESFRHAISKLAHIHFVATPLGKKRLMALGENPERIFVVGAPGLDDIYENLLDKSQLAKKYSIDFSAPYALVIQHPVVTEVDQAEEQIRNTLDALVDLRLQAVIIYPNADAGGRKMISVINKYVQRYPFFHAYPSLPRNEFLSLMRYAAVVVGNSSSGIIEAPSFGVPVVNIGTRQKGRLRAKNVIDVGYDKEEIKAAILTALRMQSGKDDRKKYHDNPWGDGKASDRIVAILSEIRDLKRFIQK